MIWKELIEYLEANKHKDLVQDIDDDGPVAGFYWHRGLAKLASGKIVDAWILKCWLDQGEHSGSIFKWGDVWMPQVAFTDSENEALKKLVFPYKYRLDSPCPGDIHRDDYF